MAYASNYVNVYAPASSTYYYIIEVAVREESWSIDTNKSRLYLEADITGNGIGFDGSDDQYLEVYWHDAKNGDVLGATTTYKKCVKDQLYQITGYIDVPHNDDGTLSGYAYTSWGKNGSNAYVPPSTTVTANLTLTTIARKSVPTVTGTTNIGNTVTINTNRKSNTFTHTLSYSFGSLTNRQIATNVGEKYENWLIPTDFYAQIPTATSGTMTLTCTTYNGSTPVGTETINVPIYVNTSTAKTTLNTPTWTIDSVTNGKTGVTNKYINNFSTLQSLSCTATNSYNSPIRSVSLIGVKSGAETPIETKSYTGTATSQTATFTNKTGLDFDSFRIRAVDARNISSNNASVGIETIAYVPITSDSQPTIVRTSQTGATAKITSFKGNFWQGNFGAVTNALTVQWKYKESGGSYSQSYTIPDASITKTNNEYTISNYTFTNGTTTDLFTYTKLYDIEFTVSDSLQNATPSTFRLSKGVPNFVIFQNKLQKNGEDIITSVATTSANGLMSSTDKSTLNNISSGLTTATIDATGTLNTTVKQTLVSKTISTAGTYLFNISVPVNYYGQSGRDIWVYLEIGSTAIGTDGVINTYVYTLHRTLTYIATVSANTIVKVTSYSTTTATYAIGTGGFLQYLRLK
jgi:hypothetical protein